METQHETQVKAALAKAPAPLRVKPEEDTETLTKDAFVAGLLASRGIARTFSRGTRKGVPKRRRLGIRIYSFNRPLLEYLVDYFGLGHVVEQPRPGRPFSSPVYSYQLNGQPAYRILERLYPHMPDEAHVLKGQVAKLLVSENPQRLARLAKKP